MKTNELQPLSLGDLTIREYCHRALLSFIRLKGYSQSNTYAVYKAHLSTILFRFPDPREATLLEIQEWAATFQNDNTRRLVCVVLRWLFDSVLGKPLDWRTLPYPKRKRKVRPVYLEADLIKVLNIIDNSKQKALLALIIDQGLRASEPCAIRLADCNSKERKIILRSAKGDHDRVVYPSAPVWGLIRTYWKACYPKPGTYLFEGQRRGEPYTTSSIRQFLERACQEARVAYLGVHAIRRFTITWAVTVAKTPLAVVAEQVGHASTRTIEKHYLVHSPTYLRDLASPLSTLQK